MSVLILLFFFSSRRRHTRLQGDWSSDVCSSDLELQFDIGSTDDSLERMVELFARLGDVYRVFVPARGSYTYVIHHPDDVKRVLVSNHRNYTKGIGLDRVRILLGKGIMTSEGELWKRQRYMMQPFFHRRVITDRKSTRLNSSHLVIS